MIQVTPDIINEHILTPFIQYTTNLIKNFNCCLTFYYSKAFFILFLKRIKSAENESGTYRQTDAEEI